MLCSSWGPQLFLDELCPGCAMPKSSSKHLGCNCGSTAGYWYVRQRRDFSEKSAISAASIVSRPESWLEMYIRSSHLLSERRVDLSRGIALRSVLISPNETSWKACASDYCRLTAAGYVVRAQVIQSLRAQARPAGDCCFEYALDLPVVPDLNCPSLAP